MLNPSLLEDESCPVPRSPMFSGSEAAYSLAGVLESSKTGATLAAVFSLKGMDSSWMVYVFP